MLIKIGFDIEFELRGPTPMMLMLYVHPSREKDLRRAQKLHVEPYLADRISPTSTATAARGSSRRPAISASPSRQ